MNFSHLSQRAGVTVESEMVIIYKHKAVKIQDGLQGQMITLQYLGVCLQ